MKRVIRIAIIVGVTFFLGILCLIFVRGWTANADTVSISLRGYQTNASQQREALVSITNRGSYIVQFIMGTEMRTEAGWVDSLTRTTNRIPIRLNAAPILRPRTERVVAIPIPYRPGPWRAVADYDRDYSRDWTGRLAMFIDRRVLKRRMKERLYTLEVQQ
jgi:hypothetical protein